MEFLREPPPGSAPCAVAVGSFDGVHLGHQEILRRLRERSAAGGLISTVLTFEPHPLRVLTRHPPLLLTVLEEKVALLEGMGVSRVVALPFDRELAGMAPADFVQDILKRRLEAREVLVGYNFTFGARGEGTAETLCHLGEAAGMRVFVIPPQEVGGRVISSTLIRERLSRGEVEEAAQLLGRPFSVRSRVVAGEGRGRGLGFPTANLRLPPEKLLPAEGVYAARVLWREREWPAVVNLGRRPTFGAGQTALEVHLLDFGADLYGAQLEIAFVHFLRPERSFASPAELVLQIRRDVARARELLR